MAVTFTVEAPASVEVENCNCSICSKSGYLHLIVPKADFELISGADDLIEYTFNTGIAKHFFCATCGIKPFYVPRSNPDGIDVNLNCLDTRPAQVTVQNFDGRNWEQHAHILAHKSAPAS
jgi:hypothetical protein